MSGMIKKKFGASGNLRPSENWPSSRYCKFRKTRWPTLVTVSAESCLFCGNLHLPGLRAPGKIQNITEWKE